ncbi:MAG: membrane protein insertase YidC [Bacteroidota bacterium]
MGFDRNTVIGFVLLAVLFFGYFFYTSSSQKKYEMEKKRYDDSVKALLPKDTGFIKQKQDVAVLQKAADSTAAGDFADAINGTEELTIVDNNVMKLTFSNKGGWLKMVELKKYKGPDSLLVKMGGASGDVFGYGINTGNNLSTSTDKLFFNKAVVNKTADGSQTLSYQLPSKDGGSITHSFVIKPDDYLLDANIGLVGADRLLQNQALNINWQVKARQQQKDLSYERKQQKMVCRTDNEFDFFTAIGPISQQFDKPTQWVGIKQQFFNSTLLAKNNFNSVTANITIPTDSSLEVGTLKTTARIQVAPGSNTTTPLQIFYGPNEYKLLKAYNNEMHNIVDLGSGVTAFVKYINRGFVMPVYGFLDRMVGGKTGWAILLLTIIIRLLISPLTYKSYLSGAKMKLLQPELKALKAKLGDDQQAYSMEQMKLFRQAGVNPLGGCIPALLQIPIFFALFAFFNSYMALRGESFLWAPDLSMYDYPITFKNIPLLSWALNGHLSIFSLMACITSFFISLYSMSSTPDQSNPMMKYLPYIFPFVMLFIFNDMPSALTWYYTVSNIITLAIQFVINNYIIDHDKILAQMAENKTKPKAKSKWQERLEAMQESQKKVQDLKSKTGKK